jgi:hypothetical protein
LSAGPGPRAVCHTDPCPAASVFPDRRPPAGTRPHPPARGQPRATTMPRRAPSAGPAARVRGRRAASWAASGRETSVRNERQRGGDACCMATGPETPSFGAYDGVLIPPSYDARHRRPWNSGGGTSGPPAMLRPTEGHGDTASGTSSTSGRVQYLPAPQAPRNRPGSDVRERIPWGDPSCQYSLSYVDPRRTGGHRCWMVPNEPPVLVPRPRPTGTRPSYRFRTYWTSGNPDYQ